MLPSNHDAEIYRQVTVSGTTDYTTTGTTIRIMLQPVSGELVIVDDAMLERHNGFVGIDVDVIRGDKLVIDSEDYFVNGVSTRDYGRLKYKHLFLRKPQI